MIRSMTGFGRASFQVEGVGFGVEIRTVNHRHADLVLRMPRMLSVWDPVVRERLQGRFARGKVEVSVSLAPGSAPKTSVEIDAELARRYVTTGELLVRECGATGSLSVDTLLALPGVARLVEHTLSEEALEAALLGALDEAAGATLAMRDAEGQALQAELRRGLARVLDLVQQLEGRAAEVLRFAKERLHKRAEQIRQETGLLDEARLHQEVVIAADRLDVREELVRLRSHVDQFEGALDRARAGEPVGRPLDFLLQEMAREANTVGSKGGDAGVAHLVVDLKTELERLREQVQNVE